MAARMPARVRHLRALCWLMIGVLAAGCASADAPTAPDDREDPPPPAATAPDRPRAAEVLVIAEFAFDPEDLLVGADREQRVRNDDGVAHTLTAWDGSFDLRVEPGEQVVLRAPPERGTYPYACSLHPQMRGEIEVG